MRECITEAPKMIGRDKAELRTDYSVTVSRMAYVKIS